MYTCINCGVEVEELYRRYSPSVLKVLKCVSYYFFWNENLILIFKIMIFIFNKHALSG